MARVTGWWMDCGCGPSGTPDVAADRRVGRKTLARALRTVLAHLGPAFDSHHAVSDTRVVGARIARLMGDAHRSWRPSIRELAASVLALAVAVTMLLSALPLIREGVRRHVR